MFDTTIQDQLLKLIYISAMQELIAQADEEMNNSNWF